MSLCVGRRRTGAESVPARAGSLLGAGMLDWRPAPPFTGAGLKMPSGFLHRPHTLP